MILTLWVMAFYAVVVFGLSSVFFSNSFQDAVIRELLFSSAPQTSSLQLTALHRDAAVRLFQERPQVH